jgi:DMSO/TMAO reductase YedYZ molybdopterin-dependent catalytic subunit
MRRPWPEEPPPGPFRRDFWRSPLRGPWLTSLLGAALLPLIVICAVTGFLSHAAYNPDLGGNSITGPGSAPFDLFFFDWPTSPSWIYAATQGLHVISGVTAIPILLAKLWSAMPKLFEWPPLRSPAHLLERLSLAMLVGGSLFVFFTGLFNIQLWYAWNFNFVASHYYGAYVFLAGLAIHLVIKVPVALRAFRQRGVAAPLRDDLAHTRAEPPEPDTTAPSAPGQPTVSRRWLLGTVGAASAGLGLMAAGQSVGGPFRELAFLAPRGRAAGDGPNDFLVNKTAASRGIDSSVTGPTWRLRVGAAGQDPIELDREQLLALPLSTHDLPIACVEGWSTTQEWTGVAVRDLAEMAGLSPERTEAYVESLQETGSFRDVTLAANQVADERSLVALRVNGADLSLDHGFPARLIVPGAPGVHCTKWVASIEFTEV